MSTYKSNLEISPELFTSPNKIQHFKGLIKDNIADTISQFHSSAPMLELINARADFTDDILRQCWRNFLGHDAKSLALIAVGGYGRRELHPQSDIDILILLDDETEENQHNSLSEFFKFLWDIGLKLGHSVRSVTECTSVAIQDQTIITNLMESRIVDGSKKLFDKMTENIDPSKIWPSNTFFEAKMEEQHHRYAKYRDSGHNLEPNVKEGPGGLRDIQLIAWVIKRHYNSRTLSELLQQGCLTKSEYDEFIQAQEFLWRVRFALHAITGRDENRLLFDYQITVAQQLGYGDNEENQAVEKFMQQYYRTVMGLQRLNEMLMQLFREVMLREHEGCSVVSINQHFQSLCDFVEVTHENVFKARPIALLEIFLVLQQVSSTKGVRAPTIRLIRQNLHLIDDKFRKNKNASNLFMEILKQRNGITHQLRRMNRYGVLAAYIPAFANIVGRMQYDLYHVYTVDEHTLFLIRNLRRFALAKFRHELPFCNDIFMLIPKPELLYVAGLFHDIAKGKGGDHSILGQKIAKDFCQQHGLNRHDTNLVTWLVRNHLLMSMTAQRKDIADPEIIREFATVVGTLERLNYIYLLTVADIRATNPSLWNSWRNSLLKELYFAVHRAFHRGLDNPLDKQEQIKSAQREARSMLKHLGLKISDVKKVWRTISEDYFLRYSPEESVWHTIAIASCHYEDLPLILLRPQNQRGSAEVFLYTKNDDYIFSHSTAILSQLGLTILDARIITSGKDYVLNSYLILEQSGDPIDDLLREQQIAAKLRAQLKNSCGLSPDVVRLENRLAKHFKTDTQIYFHTDPHHRYTILELITNDQLGLLSKVGRAFNQLQVRLHQAKITTIGSRAEDLFYITDNQDQLFDSDEIKESIKKTIIALVGEC